MNIKKQLDLHDEFPVPSWEEWKEKAVEALKGADYDKVMYTRTPEGITLKPIYRKEDLESLPFVNALPGDAPFQRGNSAEHDGSWELAQAQSEADPAALNKQILAELQRGLTMVNLALAHDDNPRGVVFKTAEDFQTALNGVDLKAAPLMAQLDMDDPDLFAWLARQHKDEIRDLPGSLGYDPIAEYARKGFLNLSWEAAWDTLEKTVQSRIEEAPKLRAISLDGTVYESAGASSAQELGFVLASALEYLRRLTDKGMDVNRIAPLFQARLALGSNFFMEIAKIRAFRMLWNEALKAFGAEGDARKIWIHGKTGSFNKSRYDLYVNLLRTSTEGFSAVIGGVDSLEIDRFDAVVNPQAEEFAKRLARNQQLILGEEAHFSKVADPAGGCYYIENLTAQLAAQAWKLMQEIEAEGGMLKCLESGKIHEMIAGVAHARLDAVHKRRDVFVGVNMYADPNDEARPAVEDKIDDSKAAVRLSQGALPRLRAVGTLENFRARIQKAKPEVFLLTMGSLAEYKARADFSAGFLQVGGFETVTGTGYTDIDTAITAAKDYQAICICSTDDKYPELVPALCAKLKGKTLILAGYPQDMVESYKKDGIDLFIHLRANVLDTLKELAAKMEVAP
ncbi:MAG: methylmalonyl-CoA mutase [Candidatus Cloacimonetes bacterium]|nr:methylmalonyl-CoA mutase [Candidatus Cloacimonadota bacterium]